MANQGAFLAATRDIIGRGSSQDNLLAVLVEEAARFLEDNFNFAYMERDGQFNLSGDRSIEFTNTRLKEMRYVRYVRGNDYYNLFSVEPREVNIVGEGFPTAYWTTGNNRVIFDAAPPVNQDPLLIQMGWYEYTLWENSDTFTHWLLDNASAALRAQLLFSFATKVRDEALKQSAQVDRETALRVLITREEERRYANRSNLVPIQ